MKLVTSVPTPFVSRTLPLPILMILLAYSLYLSLSFSMYQNFLLSTYEFFVVAKPNREFVFFVFTVVSITINIVFGILMPPTEDLDDQYVRLDEVKDYTLLEVSDEDYYHYYKCSDCDEDDNGQYGSDGYYEDDDDDGSDDDINSDDFYGEAIDSEELQRRAEEFIAKNTRKWREEFIYEKRDQYKAAIE